MIALLIFAAVTRWYESYNLGVNAVRAKNYQAGAEALSAAIAQMPAESGAARAGNTIITYTPHFWLGIARFNLGDLDGALREWKISEDQGAVQNTPYYAQLREWVARANLEKQRRLQSAASDSKREANTAMGRALSAQTDAVAAGADRSDAYRAAQRKLREAVETHDDKQAADLATQARDLFAGAAADAKREKAARPKPEPQPQPLKTVTISVPFEPAPVPPPVPVESEASVSARIAAQNEHRKQIEAKTKPVMPPVDLRGPLESAYRAFAVGDFVKADALLTQVLATNASAEAYLLRGCARYTQATLARGQLDAAAQDFQAALALNKALKLDSGAFSPKLVAYFDQLRKN
jgi:hypothetical protein